MEIEEINKWASWIKNYIFKVPSFYKENIDYSEFATDTLISLYEKGIKNYSVQEFKIYFNRIFARHCEYILANNRKLRRTVDDKKRASRKYKKWTPAPIKFNCEGRTIDHVYYSPLGGQPHYFFK
jgi:hypothetical protein